MELCDTNLDLVDYRQRYAVAFSTLAIGDFAYESGVKPGFTFKETLCLYFFLEKYNFY